MSELKKTIKEYFVIPIIKVICLDEQGEQIPELQKYVYPNVKHFLEIAKQEGYDLSKAKKV